MTQQGDDDGHRKADKEVHGGADQAPSAGNPGTTVSVTCPHGTFQVPSEGIRAGEVTGVRAWRVKKPLLPVLRSVVVPYYWDYDQPATGNPLHENHGIYAYLDYDAMSRDLFFNQDFGTPWVTGKVEMWGTILEFNAGYRAEFARVVEFNRAFELSQKDFKELARNYNVPIIPR